MRIRRPSKEDQLSALINNTADSLAIAALHRTTGSAEDYHVVFDITADDVRLYVSSVDGVPPGVSTSEDELDGFHIIQKDKRFITYDQERRTRFAVKSCATWEAAKRAYAENLIRRNRHILRS